MVQKRPFVEEFSDVSSKQPSLDYGSQLVPFLELPFQDVSNDCYTSEDLGKSCFSKCMTESHVKLESDKIIDSPMFAEKDIDILSGNNSNSSWPSSCMSEEDVRPEAQDYSPVRPRRIINQPKDAYSYLMQRPPQKLIPIGPDFQAHIPEWCGPDAMNVSACSVFAEASTFSQALESNLKNSDKTDIKLLGECIISMPEIRPASCDIDKIGTGRTDCCCEDPGSVQCVRHHVREARVNLRTGVGLENFLDLGFGDMGETVAEKWSDEDEELFHDVVYSNPASSGKNFWHRLASVFPFRTSSEIVSYYFNVFMLRKRAEQNRCTPKDVDSDNDEWEENDESDEEEGTYQNEICDDDSYNHEGVENPNFNIHNQIDFHSFKGMPNDSDTWPMTSFNDSCSNSSSQHSEKTSGDEMGAYNFQDDSATTFNTAAGPQVSQEKLEDSKHWGHDEFISEPCDAKMWNNINGYSTFPRSKSDFLPTYSMIEEVFGVEDWKQDTRDDSNNSTQV